MPPTEKGSRVHTSSITVSVMNFLENNLEFKDEDFKIEWFSGTGAGGQHRNRTKNCVRIIHIPSGIKQECQGKSRKNNLRDAKKTLIKTLNKKENYDINNKISSIRKNQMGSGQRGDKFRTYKFHKNIVEDYRSKKRTSCSEIKRGKFYLLWK